MIEVDALNRSLLYELFDLALGIEALGRRAARAVASQGLLEVDARLLQALLSADQTQADLARSLTMDTGQVARTVRRLKNKGLVEHPLGPRDAKKSRELRLTLAGREAALAAGARRRKVIEEFVAEDDGTKLSRLFTACAKLHDRHYWQHVGAASRI